MKNKRTLKKFLAITGIISSLLFSSISALAVENTAPRKLILSRAQGTVAILDAANKPMKAYDNMKMSSGCNIVTNIGSYAWVNIDDNLVKLDSLSKVKIAQSGENLIVDVNAGKIFVDISKNPANNESLLVRSSGVIAIIKDTSAEINVQNGNTKIVCLDGKIDCVVIDSGTGQLKPVEVLPGKKVEIEPTASVNSIITKAATKNDISGFAKLQIAQDPELKKNITVASGSKIGNITETEAVKSISQDMANQVTELVAMAEESGTDAQSVINAMMGADVSSKSLDASTKTSSSSSDTNQSSSDVVASDSEPKHTHNYENTSNTPATCTSTGSNVYTCKGCGDLKIETIPKLAHDYEEISYTDPTCTTDATRELKCKVCEYLTTETISGSATGHIYDADAETTEEIKEGADSDNCADIKIAVSKYCSRCERMIDQGIQLKYDSHNYSIEVESRLPTCTANGRIKKQCDHALINNSSYLCTATITFEDPAAPALGHSYGGDKNYYYNLTDACYYLQCINRFVETCESREDYPHTLKEAEEAELPGENYGNQYIKCAEDDCNIYAKYSWNDTEGKYIFDSWVEKIDTP